MVPYFFIYILTSFLTNFNEYCMKKAFHTLCHRCNLPTRLISFCVAHLASILYIFSVIKDGVILASITFTSTKPTERDAEMKTGKERISKSRFATKYKNLIKTHNADAEE